MYLIKTFRSHVAVKYEKTERRIVATRTPSIQMVTHEISTQTDAEYHMIYTATSSTTASEISEDGGAPKSK